MQFFIDELNKILPPEFTDQTKSRLRDGLSQFHKSNLNNDKYYTEFYLSNCNSYFLQGDLIKELRFPVFNPDNRQYEKLYYDALIISNTCDIDDANKRNVPKNAVLAKVITFDSFVETLNELDNVESAAEILTQIKNQQFSNIIYLPPTKNNIDYIAYLDDFSIIDIKELNVLKNDIDQNRIESLDYFGYYLFIFKLSYHFCRLPEETQR
jgi:hypothetical protein